MKTVSGRIIAHFSRKNKNLNQSYQKWQLLLYQNLIQLPNLVTVKIDIFTGTGYNERTKPPEESGKKGGNTVSKFFEVVTKCGHVGRQQYYRGVFYMSAESGKKAASVARTFPRVKHDHPDAILQVRCISKEEYLEGRSRFLKEAYFQCHNVQEQRSRWSEISPNVFPEEQASRRYGAKEQVSRQHRRRNREKPFYWRTYDGDDAA